MDQATLAAHFLRADDHAMKQKIHFHQLQAMARKAGEQFDRLVEFRADCEAELAATMRPGQEIRVGDRVLVRVDRDGFPAVAIENAVEEVIVA